MAYDLLSFDLEPSSPRQHSLGIVSVSRILPTKQLKKFVVVFVHNA
jgi:hypothetical protein